MENNNLEEKSQKVLDSINEKTKITKYIVYSFVHTSVFIVFCLALKDWVAIIFAYALYLLFSRSTLPKLVNLCLYTIHRKEYKEIKKEHEEYQETHSAYLEEFFKKMLIETFYSDDAVLNTPTIRLLKKEIKESAKKSEIREIVVEKFIDTLKLNYELVYFQENEEDFFVEYDNFLNRELNSKTTYKDLIFLLREIPATKKDLDNFERMKVKIRNELLELESKQEEAKEKEE